MAPTYLSLALACVLVGSGCGDDPALAPDAAGPSPWDEPLRFELERVAADPLEAIEDLALTDAGRMVALTSAGELAVSDDLGGSWRRCALPEPVGVRTIAIAPDGERVFIGGLMARWRVVDTSCAVQRSGSVNHPVDGDYSSFAVTSADWLSRDGILVGLSNAARTDGVLVLGVVPASTTQLVSWDDLRPTAIHGGNTALPAAVQSVHRTSNGVYLAGLNRYLSSAGGSIPELHEGFVNGSTMSWASGRVPDVMGRVPRSIAARTTNVSPTLYIVDRDTRDVMYVARFGVGEHLREAHEVTLTGFTGVEVTARYRVARLDAEHRIWLATDRGLFRSTTALPPAD